MNIVIMKAFKKLKNPKSQGISVIAKEMTFAYNSKNKKNIKFKQKAKQMVDLHRKQVLLDEYLVKDSTVNEIGKDILQHAPRSNMVLDIQAYDELMSSMLKNCEYVGRSIGVEHTNKCQLEAACEVDTVKNSLDNNSNQHIIFESSTNESQTLLHDTQKEEDMFYSHMSFELSYKDVKNSLVSTSKIAVESFQWPNLGSLRVEVPIINKNPTVQTDFAFKFRNLPYRLNAKNLHEMGVKAVWKKTYSFSPLESEFFAIINQYQDLYYPECLRDKDLCKAYSMHILNHMLKTRSCILRHNMKLRTSTAIDVTRRSIVLNSCRDQGLSRPKVLVVLPFRKSAFQVVNNLTQLLFNKNIEFCKSDGSVTNCNRFIEEYSGNTLQFSSMKRKPDDYEQIFSGNIDDNFRIGITLTKKCLKLYTDINLSDIIITSPLGLRLFGSSVSERNYDFLNSIEILIMDQADMFFAQNWENVLLVFDHLHLQPQSVQNIDLKRVRPWCLNGLSKYYRQTIIVSSHELPELRSVFNNKCLNYRGKVYVSNPTINGNISNVFVAIPQVFHFIDISNLDLLCDLRFRYFVQEVFPRYRKPQFTHCMIFIPSYFDFVRIRNYLKSESVSFAQISEYTRNSKISRARDMFFHSGVHFLLYSERSHFFRRTRIKGIRHLIMYQPPMWTHLYSEMINMMNSSNQNRNDGLDDFMSITVLFTRFDSIQLNGVLGSKAASELINSNKTVHALTIM